MPSMILIVSDAMREAANRLGEAIGRGPNNYSVALSPTGQPPATHWGCRAEASQEFLDLLANPPEEAIPIMQAVHIDTSDVGDPRAHFLGVAAELGLQMITDMDEAGSDSR